MPVRLLLLPFMLGSLMATAAADTVRRGLGPEPDSLDIHQAQGLSSLQVLRDLNEGLVTFDAAGRLVGGAAESWSVSGDGLTLSFRLRADARWSNGDPVLAEDFVRAWERAVAPRSQARTASLLLPVRGVAAILAGEADPSAIGVAASSPRELTVHLERPTPWFPEVLAHPVTFPLHPAAGEVVSERPVNGPFVLAEMVPRARLRLAANPQYHAADSVRLEAVEYYPIEDPGQELARYRSGELDATETIPPGRFDWLQENLATELRVSPYLGSFWIGINLRNEPLGSSADLRRALALAIDRETLVRVVLGAGEAPAWGVVPPGLDGYAPQPDPASRLPKAEREERARALYRRAGYGPERPLRLELRFNTSTQHRRMAVAVAAMWKQLLDVRTDLIQEEWKVFVNNRRQGVLTELFRGGWIADFADPVTFLDLFRSDSELNTTFYDSAAYDRLLAEAAGRSGGQRMQLLQQAETLLLRDLPVIPLYFYVSRHLVKPHVRGWEDNARDVHLSRYLAIEGSGE